MASSPFRPDLSLIYGANKLSPSLGAGTIGGMLMSKDVKGYYAQLEVEYDASANEIKSAYRRLAKAHHPDTASITDNGFRFRAITEAYSILCDPEARAAYDSFSATETDQQTASRPGAVIDPIACSACSQITAQPRYVVFQRVISVVFATYRTPVQGIYCSACARKAALQATLISAVMGWWGFPWGPVWTITEGIKNAFGGSNTRGNEERLLWHNALAFASRGETKLSFALADKLRSSTNTETAKNAEDLIAFFRSRGIDHPGSELVDPWRRHPLATLFQIVMIAAPPAALAIFIFMATSGGTPIAATTYPNPAAPYSSRPGDASASSETQLQPGPEVVEPTCKEELANGEQLSGNMRPRESGHVLEISNGAGGDAIIKLRRWPSKSLAASFLVLNNQKAAFSGIADGEYIVQYAFGSAIAADCKTFTKTTSAGQFPDVEALKTTREPVVDGVRIGHSQLSYTLYAVPAGNVQPEGIDPSSFDAD